jgi:hypothetical protein
VKTDAWCLVADDYSATQLLGQLLGQILGQLLGQLLGRPQRDAIAISRADDAANRQAVLSQGRGNVQRFSGRGLRAARIVAHATYGHVDATASRSLPTPHTGSGPFP